MKNYVGTKKIKAKPMTRGEYNVLRGWTLPADENGDDEGYLVEYLDSPNSNVRGFDNYVSWSPKDVFERAYEEGSISDTERINMIEGGLEVQKFIINKTLWTFIYDDPCTMLSAPTLRGVIDKQIAKEKE